jgi:hypothetical protein
MTKNYYLAVWGVSGKLSEKDAAQQYALSQLNRPLEGLRRSSTAFTPSLPATIPKLK